MVKSNFEKVEAVVGWVRDKKITGYRISKETNHVYPINEPVFRYIE